MRLSVLFCLLLPFMLCAQLPGKTFVLRQPDAPQAYVYFYNDSLLSFARDAGDSMIVETFRYETDSEGTLHYCSLKQVPDPVIRMYRSEQPVITNVDVRNTHFFLINPLLPDLVIEDRWEVCLDGRPLAYGGEAERLKVQNLQLPGAGFTLLRFNRFYGENHPFTVSDFSGNGDYFVVETIFPRLFYYGSTVFHPADLQHTFPLQFREGILLNPLTQQQWENY